MTLTVGAQLTEFGAEVPAPWLYGQVMAYTPAAHQKEMMSKYLKTKRFMDAGEPGCVSGDTEYLTPTGWKRIDEYGEGDLVAQYNPDTEQISFTKPLRYIKEPCEWMYHVNPRQGLNMMLSPDHRVLHYDNNGYRHRVDSMDEVYRQHTTNVTGFRGIIKTLAEFEGHGVNLTHEQIRVMVMTMADGHFTNANSFRCIIRVKKDRKKERAKRILDDAGIVWKEYQKPDNFVDIVYYAPRKHKTYPKEWWGMTQDQKGVVLDEARYWDSSDDARGNGAYRFTSSVKGDADFIQFCAITSKKEARRNASVTYRLHKIKSHYLHEYTCQVHSKGVGMGLSKSTSSHPNVIVKTPTADGLKYCFQVPSGFLLLRYKGKPFTTGNCGKTLPAHFHGIVEAAAGKKVLYTMPPKLIGQFYDEMLNVFPGIENHLHIEKLNVSAADKVKLREKWDKTGWPDILMLSYDNYREYNDVSKVKNIGTNQWYNSDGNRIIEVDKFPGTAYTKDGRPITKRKRKGVLVGTAVNDKHLLLTRKGYNVQFFDEAHYLCGLKSIISQSVSDAARRDASIYLMTGTPVPTDIVNAYGIIRLINPEAYGNLASFERQHIVKRPMTIMRGGRPATINVADHYINTEKIHTELFRFARRIQKREIHKLPDPIIQDVKVVLTGKHKKLYDTFMKNQFAVIGDTILSPDSQQQARHMSLQLISCPNVFDPELSMKNDLYGRFKELVDSINPRERKVVVFAYHKVVIDFLHAELAEYNPAILNGSTADSEEQIRRFKEDKDCGVFVVNWESGGAGLNLQMASHVIFYEVPGVKAFKQGVARCDRTGQTETVNVYIMRVLSTLSDRSFSRLLKAEEDLNEVVKDELDLLYKVVGRPRK